MRRAAIVGSLVALALGAIGIVAIVRHSGGSKTVATVEGRKITEDELELTVEHFHEEADREGRPFPADGSDQFKQVRKVALGLLIDRAAIEAAAARIGVHITDTQVDNRLGASPGESEGGGDIRVRAEAAFRRGTTRTQLITEAVFRKLTAGIQLEPGAARAYYRRHRALYRRIPFVRVAPAIRSQLLSTRKNAAMARWLAGVRRGEPTTERLEG